MAALTEGLFGGAYVWKMYDRFIIPRLSGRRLVGSSWEVGGFCVCRREWGHPPPAQKGIVSGETSPPLRRVSSPFGGGAAALLKGDMAALNEGYAGAAPPD